MRTFQIIILTCLAIAGLTACPSTEDNCASTDGCGDDDPMGPDAGGGETCSTDDGDACPAPLATHADAPGVCNDPDYPVLCPDNEALCWPAGTDCGLPRFPCGSVSARCERDQAANCCGGEAFLCPEDAPYYCTEDGTCRTSSNQCASTCEYYGANC